MNSKSKILNKLRTAVSSRREAVPPVVPDKEIYADYQADKDEMLQQFIVRQENLHGEVITCISVEEMARALSNILNPFEPETAKYFPDELIDQVFKIDPGLKNFFDYKSSLSISSPDFSRYEVGVSGAEYLVSRTGSIFLNSKTAGGRRLTVLPPVHIVLARRDQMVSSLDNVIQEIKNREMDWSYATFITGPSRTSDIEKRLVLGAHGPKRLITLILNS
jgi:L-lactate dehydrogenase complex protein LldG